MTGHRTRVVNFRFERKAGIYEKVERELSDKRITEALTNALDERQIEYRIIGINWGSIKIACTTYKDLLRVKVNRAEFKKLHFFPFENQETIAARTVFLHHLDTSII